MHQQQTLHHSYINWVIQNSQYAMERRTTIPTWIGWKNGQYTPFRTEHLNTSLNKKRYGVKLLSTELCTPLIHLIIEWTCNNTSRNEMLIICGDSFIWQSRRILKYIPRKVQKHSKSSYKYKWGFKIKTTKLVYILFTMTTFKLTEIPQRWY